MKSIITKQIYFKILANSHIIWIDNSFEPYYKNFQMVRYDEVNMKVNDFLFNKHFSKYYETKNN